MAYTYNLPLLLIREDGVQERGIFYRGAGDNIVYMPQNADANWFNSDAFMRHFNPWRIEVRGRCHVFLGYSGNAQPTAVKVRQFLESLGVRVMDWSRDFKPGKSVLSRIHEAETRCLGGIFLFMKDDKVISKGVEIDAPRDNVIFEAGYFMNTKGSDRILLICEPGVKILSDLKGILYRELTDRTDISSIENDLKMFIQDNF